jgi:disulfide bond formation protein DsbB
MNYILKKTRVPFLFICTASLALVSGGVLLSELLHLAACPLCIVQRMLYLALAFVAAIGLVLAFRPLLARFIAILLAGIAGTGLFVAGYQVWIQRFSPETNCSARPTWWEDLVEQAGDTVPILFKASGLCSDQAWTFLNLSIADWSLAWFTLFLLVSLYALLRRRH